MAGRAAALFCLAAVVAFLAVSGGLRRGCDARQCRDTPGVVVQRLHNSHSLFVGAWRLTAGNASAARRLHAAPLPGAPAGPTTGWPRPLPAGPRLPAAVHPRRQPLRLFRGRQAQPEGAGTASRPGVTAEQPPAFPLELLRTVTVSDAFPTGEVVTVHQPGVTEYYELAEGLWSQETLYFKVTGRPLVHLKRRQSTYMSKLMMTVETKVVDLGSFAPSDEEYSVAFPGSKVPGGFVIRGHYRSTWEFYDDLGPVCPPLVKEFAIVRHSDRFQLPPPR